jgi:hypothetical protein
MMGNANEVAIGCRHSESHLRAQEGKIDIVKKSNYPPTRRRVAIIDIARSESRIEFRSGHGFMRFEAVAR